TPCGHGLAILSPASYVWPFGVDSVAALRSPPPQPPGLHRAAGKFVAARLRLARNFGHRLAPDAAHASFVGRAAASNVSPELTVLRRASCPPGANERAVR